MKYRAIEEARRLAAKELMLTPAYFADDDRTGCRFTFKFRVKTDQDTAGRWVATIPERPGIVCYGKTEGGVLVDTLRVLACSIEEAGGVTHK